MMTGDLFLVAVVVGVFGGWLVHIVIGKGAYGLLGDLTLGLIGATIAVSVYQAVGFTAYAGVIGAMVAALMGSVGAVLAPRNVRFLSA